MRRPATCYHRKCRITLPSTPTKSARRRHDPSIQLHPYTYRCWPIHQIQKLLRHAIDRKQLLHVVRERVMWIEAVRQQLVGDEALAKQIPIAIGTLFGNVCLRIIRVVELNTREQISRNSSHTCTLGLTSISNYITYVEWFEQCAAFLASNVERDFATHKCTVFLNRCYALGQPQ